MNDIVAEKFVLMFCFFDKKLFNYFNNINML
jgi:hypothetical protein